MTLTADLTPSCPSPRAAWTAGAAGVVVLMSAMVALSPRPVEQTAPAGAARHRGLAALLHLTRLRRPIAAEPGATAEVAPLPASPFILHAKTPAERERAVACLANAVYYEGALEPEDGQRAIAQVVLNRVRDPNFPKSVCGVVYQGWEKSTGCQFSFTCDGSLSRPPMTSYYAAARRVAQQALNGSVMAQVGWATHYHASYVDPWWRSTVVRVGQVGAHIFYRWPGGAGLPSAFDGRYAGRELALSEAALTGRAPHFSGGGGPGGADALALGMVQLPPIKSVGPDGMHARVHAVFDPSPIVPIVNGQPMPTREQIARMNALIAAKYPDAAGAEAKPEPPPAAAPALVTGGF